MGTAEIYQVNKKNVSGLSCSVENIRIGGYGEVNIWSQKVSSTMTGSRRSNYKHLPKGNIYTPNTKGVAEKFINRNLNNLVSNELMFAQKKLCATR